MSVYGTLATGKLTQGFSDWLYGPWNEEKYNQYLLLSLFPPANAYMNYLLDKRNDKKILDRYDMTYEDIYDPRNLRQSSSYGGVYRSSLNFVSSNINRLY